MTVKVGRESRTFNDGDGITFPRFVGAKRRLSVNRVEFAGYGLDAPGARYSDMEGKDYRDAAVVFLGIERTERSRWRTSAAAWSAAAAGG